MVQASVSFGCLIIFLSMVISGKCNTTKIVIDLVHVWTLPNSCI